MLCRSMSSPNRKLVKTEVHFTTFVQKLLTKALSTYKIKYKLEEYCSKALHPCSVHFA